MGFDDALNKAKGFADDNPDKAEKGIDTASDQLKERTGGKHDEHIDRGSDAAKDHLGLGGQDKKQDK